ncbi:serine/threonine-protein kinase [Actimicrobium sp. CCC2.4]|uniref:serine/threonine-protein kinase n=1 Tax=Actimicrobium sp. CCC2.4 TaxID=3048606 RepID=UPI002AC94D11|nr:serine/threonine-protein kinase [Actimicrobium sp. CCC2.4]MEB0134826.1 serine/threonine-protein kinase [Actimicrobium sp. CCC2.4]WPX30764.1 serine/threonine-protein kinase [Actimicrobium sp. CCC2.4]
MSLSDTARPPMPSRHRIGRYHLTRELGRGTLSTVYLGHDPVIDRAVAIKALHHAPASPGRRRQESQLINEARATGRLSHPHIVTIFEASSEGPDTYIAMEYLKGSALSTLLAAGHRFEFDAIATICWKLADALDHAHHHDVVHRDIKPANIFLVGDHQPKLVDFGIARVPDRAGSSDNPETLFCHNLLGTPNYMSPEQASGQQVDHRTDLYSLGVVMYQMLTGQTPFQAVETAALLQLIASATPARPHALNTSIPRTLSRIAMKAMHKQADKRYQDAGELARDLKRYLVYGKRTRRRLRMGLSESGDGTTHRRTRLLQSALLASCAALTGAVAVLLLR